MQLNGPTINSVTLNGASGFQVAPPIYVVQGQSFVWRLRLVVAGVDRTARLTGVVDVDREEGAAGVAGFALHLAAGAVVPPDWVGQTVTLDYISTALGVTTESRRFTGRISSPTWDPLSRILNCECSDQLQQRVEAMTLEQVDALVSGYWSADVFDPVEGRSRWDYALERLSTLPSSLECDPYGVPRVTSWYATAPHFVFGPGATLYQSASVDLAPLSNITNRVEIEFSYRYPRLWQRNQGYGWQHPGTEGAGGIGGFCLWRQDSTELPTKEMVAEAADSAGMTLLAPVYYELPLSMADPCGDGFPWLNTLDNLLLGVNWVGARRWVQTVTETYTLVLATAAGVDPDTRIVRREAYSLEVESSESEAWEEDPILGGESGATDVDDAARRDAAMIVALHVGRTEIIGAHRETTLSWSVPASLAMGVDLSHTLELDDQGMAARGKCRRIVDSFDLDSGEAITTLNIAVMRGGGTSDPLTLPARLGADLDGGDGSFSLLETQIGGRFDSPAYDDELDGFAGNYSSTSPGSELYPRRLAADVDEILAEDRDERLLAGETLYSVGIPNDQLEM